MQPFRTKSPTVRATGRQSNLSSGHPALRTSGSFASETGSCAQSFFAKHHGYGPLDPQTRLGRSRRALDSNASSPVTHQNKSETAPAAKPPGWQPKTRSPRLQARRRILLRTPHWSKPSSSAFWIRCARKSLISSRRNFCGPSFRRLSIGKSRSNRNPIPDSQPVSSCFLFLSGGLCAPEIRARRI